MADVKRPYDASLRRERARARRLAVIVAARELFERDGFRATTLADVAAHADVSVEGIYKTFGSKAALAKAVFDVVIAGDDEPTPIAERPEMDAIRAEPAARRKIQLVAAGLAQRQARSAKVQILIRDARHVDASLEPVWTKLASEALTGATGLARQLVGTGELPVSSTEERLRDILWNYFAIDHYERLVLHRNWSFDAYTSWLAAAIIAAATSE